MVITVTPTPTVLCRVIKTLSSLFCFTLVIRLLSPVSGQGSLLHPLESVYLLGLIPVAITCEVVFPLSPWQQRFPFLPLLATSVYCSVGVCYSFLRLYVSLLQQEAKPKQM